MFIEELIVNEVGRVSWLRGEYEVRGVRVIEMKKVW